MTVFNYRSERACQCYRDQNWEFSFGEDDSSRSYIYINSKNLTRFSVNLAFFALGSGASIGAITGFALTSQLVYEVGVNILNQVSLDSPATLALKEVAKLSFSLGGLLIAKNRFDIQEIEIEYLVSQAHLFCLESIAKLSPSAKKGAFYLSIVISLLSLPVLVLKSNIVTSLLLLPAISFITFYFGVPLKAFSDFFINKKIDSDFEVFTPDFVFSLKKILISTGLYSQSHLDQTLEESLKRDCPDENLHFLEKVGAQIDATEATNVWQDLTSGLSLLNLPCLHKLSYLLKNRVDVDTLTDDLTMLDQAASYSYELDQLEGGGAILPGLADQAVERGRKVWDNIIPFLVRSGADPVPVITKLQNQGKISQAKRLSKIYDQHIREVYQRKREALSMLIARGLLNSDSSMHRAYNDSLGHKGLKNCFKEHVLPFLVPLQQQEVEAD